MAVRDGSREVYWRGVLRRQAKCVLSIRAFCRRERISEPSFYAWRRTIAERDAAGKRDADSRAARAGRGTKSPGKRSSSRASHKPEFVRVSVDQPSSRDATSGANGFALELAGGRVLRMPGTMPVEQLAALIRAIETDVSEERLAQAHGFSEAAR